MYSKHHESALQSNRRSSAVLTFWKEPDELFNDRSVRSAWLWLYSSFSFSAKLREMKTESICHKVTSVHPSHAKDYFEHFRQA